MLRLQNIHKRLGNIPDIRLLKELIPARKTVSAGDLSGDKAGNWAFRYCEKSYKDLGFSTDRLCKWINDMSVTYDC